MKKILLIIISVVLLATSVLFIYNFLGSKEYTVTFVSDSGKELKIEKVRKNQSAQPPIEPQMSYGKIFKSWNESFSKVKKDIVVNPICEDVSDKSNVFALPGAYGSNGDYIYLPLMLCGDVCVSGFDITVNYDKDKLLFHSVYDEDGSVIYNAGVPGTIKINYVSAKNTTTDIDICKLKFAISSDEECIPIQITINKVYAFEDSEDLANDKLYNPETNKIESTVYVIS